MTAHKRSPAAAGAREILPSGGPGGGAMASTGRRRTARKIGTSEASAAPAYTGRAASAMVPAPAAAPWRKIPCDADAAIQRSTCPLAVPSKKPMVASSSPSSATIEPIWRRVKATARSMAYCLARSLTPMLMVQKMTRNATSSAMPVAATAQSRAFSAAALSSSASSMSWASWNCAGTAKRLSRGAQPKRKAVMSASGSRTTPTKLARAVRPTIRSARATGTYRPPAPGLGR